MAYTVKNKDMFSDFDREMAAVKSVLLENISSSKSALSIDLSIVNKNIGIADKTPVIKNWVQAIRTPSAFGEK